MNITGVKLTHFKNFLDQHVLDLSQGPGLYFVSGVNKKYPNLGGNATGKSSLWDAPSWCLFGRTARGVRASAVIPWSLPKATCTVQTDFELDGVRHNVQRTQQPNGLWLDGRAVVQKDVDDLLGYRYESFLYGILIGQFGQTFLDLSPTEKLSVFSDLLGLDVWVRARGNAKTLYESLSGRRERLKNECIRLEGSLGELERSITEETARIEEKSRGRRKEYTAALDEQTVAQGRIDEATKRLRGAHRGKDASLAADKEKERLVTTAEKAFRGADAAWKQSGFKLKDADHAVENLRDRLQELKSAFPDCPVCGQRVTKKHLDDETRRLNERLRTAVAARNAAENVEEQTKIVASTIDKQWGKAKADWAAAEKDLRGAEHNVLSATSELSRCEEGMQLIKNRLLELSQPPDNRVLDGLVGRRDKMKRELSIKNRESSEVDKTAERYGFWVDGFKDLRLWLVDSALRQLEAVVNSSLIQLGLEGWSMRFDVERETKSGSISRGFSTFIRSPDVDRDVPWEVYCGGETQRLRLAGAMGLMDLIAERLGRAPDLEIWDEPTQHLSPEGVDDLLVFLRERAAASGKRIFLVDHHSLDSGQFDGQIEVTRDKDGSSWRWLK